MPRRYANQFATTHWSLVQAAGHKSSRTARAALEVLCQTYWSAVYAFIRQRGRSVEQAEDLTQGFFVHLMGTEFLRSADRDRGRFRSYLLKSVSNFLNAEHRAENAIKRGGEATILQIDFEAGEQFYRADAVGALSAEQIFERRWALTVLNNTMMQLRHEYKERNHLKLFESLEAHLNQDASRVSYAALCEALSMTEDAIKQAARRLKLRYREILRSEIANTIGSTDEIDDELRALMAALSS